MCIDDQGEKSRSQGEISGPRDAGHLIALRHITIPSDDRRYRLTVAFVVENAPGQAAPLGHIQAHELAGKLLLEGIQSYREQARALTKDRVIEYRWDAKAQDFRRSVHDAGKKSS